MSKSPEILNLDDLTGVVKTVKLDGVSHTATEMTVEGYITRLKRAKEIAAQSGDTEVPQEQKIEDAVTFITDTFPTISPDRVRKMQLRQLTAIITYAMAAPEDIAASAESEAQAQNQAKDPNA